MRTTTPWAAAAACATAGVDFFPGRHDSAAIADAKAICRTCPVKSACLDDILDREGGSNLTYRSGIWGSLTPPERHREYRRRLAAAKRAAEDATGEQAMGRQLKLTDEQRAEVRARYAAGESLAALAREHDVGKATIQRAVRGIVRTAAPAVCGTTGGYRAHLARGEETCRRCKNANADADRRLRNTGTTLAAA